MATPPVAEPPAVAAPAPRVSAPPVAAPAKKGGKGGLVIVVVVVLLAVLGGAGYLLKDKFLGAKKGTAAPGTAFIQVNAVPWGTVKSVAATDGSLTRAVDQPTPLQVAVPPGEYTVIVSGPDGQEQSQTVKVGADAPASYQPVFGSVDVDAIVNSSK